MNYTKATLQSSTKQALIDDIEAISWNGEPVFTDFPNVQQVNFSGFDVFVVTNLSRIVVTQAEYNEAGEETASAVMGDWTCNIVLPKGYDTSTLNTKV